MSMCDIVFYGCDDGGNVCACALSLQHSKSKLLRKIPPGAEASNVLVGEVEYLEKPLIAFVRLSQAVMLGDLTEVPIPTRFLFILLGPVGNRSRFHEVGRSVSTLMADEVCCVVCVCVCVCVRACVHACMRVCMCVCVRMYVYVHHYSSHVYLCINLRYIHILYMLYCDCCS